MTARPRVLVVEDDATLRMLCSLNLAAEGLEVIEAEDGRRGLECALADPPPDFVLSDVRMPGLDGFELAAELRRDERTRTVPLLFLSADAGAANPARARALGALAYLTKPFDPVALAALIAETLTGALRCRPA
jgi:CheY-like chemotaxis protein